MKIVLITGANRGIGLSTANLFLENGWRVIGTYHNHPCEIKNDNFKEVKLDLSDKNSIQKSVEEIKAFVLNSTINVLMNNAGVQLKKLSVTNTEIIRKVFEINFFGLVDFTEQLLTLISTSGHIINISSRKSLLETPIDKDVLSGYRMSKSALNMYTKTLAYRVKESKIMINSFSPGWVKTDMGYSIATETEKPERETFEVAQELYKIANDSNLESGLFIK